MADKRITDFTEAASAGADYYLVTDSITDGVKKIKPTSIVPAYTGDVTSTAGGTVNTIAANAVTNAKAAQMAAGTIKSNITGALASASDNTINAVMDAAFGSIQGAVAYRGATGWTSLAPGTSGQFFQTSGPSANPIWQTIPGGGNMLSTNNLSDVGSITTALTNLRTFQTNTDAAGASGASGIAAGITFTTLGKSAAGDGGGGQWIVATADPGSTLKLNLNGSGKWGKNLDRALRPQQFGAIKGGTNQQQAFQDLASEIRWRAANGGGVRVEFDDVATYGVFDTGSAAVGLMDLSGTRGVKINFNGSKLVTANPFATTGENMYMLFGDNVDDIEVNGFFAQQTATSALDSTRGVYGVTFGAQSRGINVRGFRQIGGLSAFAIVPNISGSVTFDANSPSHGIHFDGETDTVFYGVNTRFNGHQLDAKLRALKVGRAYFVYNIRQHRVDLDVQPGATNESILIKCYAQASPANNWQNRTSDIHVRARSQGAAPSIANVSLAHIGIEQSTATNVTFAEISDITLDLNVDNAGGGLTRVLTTSRLDYTGAADTATNRNYIINNINVAGTFFSTGSMGTNIIEAFVNSGSAVGTWTNDYLGNINFKNIQQPDVGNWNIGANYLKGAMTLENVYAPNATLTLNTPAAGQLDASRQVSFSNFKSALSVDLTANTSGYQRLPNGRVEMYGNSNVPSNTNTVASFPLTVSIVESALLTSYLSGSSASALNVSTASTTGLTINAPTTWAGGQVLWRVIARI